MEDEIIETIDIPEMTTEEANNREYEEIEVVEEGGL